MQNSRHDLASDVPAGLSADLSAEAHSAKVEANSAKAEALAEAGLLVEVRGRRWRLIDTRRFDRCSLVTLQGVDRDDLGETLRVLSPFDRIVRRRRQPRIRLAGRLAVAQRVTDAVLASHPWLACWTAAGANITLLPWQLEPALAVLGGVTRVLLADAVGLGKTVQAGLILAELVARGLVDRALVLTPAGLRAQWSGELAARFALRATILDQAALAREAADLPPDLSPWATSSIVISSIDLVKRPEVATAVDRVPFDLLIVDEAHHATPGSDRGATVERIARRTPWVVLISATPHSGDEQAFTYLTSIGGGGPDTLTIFRRSPPGRERRTRSKLVAVRTSAAESELLDAVHAYATAIWRDRGVAHPAARLVAAILARRAASHPDAVLTTLRRRRLLLDRPEPGREPPAAPTGSAASDQLLLPWEEADDADGDAADSVLICPGLARPDEERRWLNRLIDLAVDAHPSPAKALWIERWLARVREPTIVFSEYRDTVEALRARLERLTAVEVLHGGMSPAMRRAATASFVGGSAMLLLATDAGGEGLNLHARCRAVIDNELPWNPARLEQRVGRVDRLGQRRTVHAVHLLHAGSIEQTMLVHLHRRVARAATAVALGRDFDAQVAASIFGGSAMPSLASIEWPHRPMPEAADEARRIEHLRVLAHAKESRPVGAMASTRSVPIAAPRRSPISGSTDRSASSVDLEPAVMRRARQAGAPPDAPSSDGGGLPVATSPGKRMLTAALASKATLLCAFQVTLADAHGRALAQTIVPLLVDLASPPPRAARELLFRLQRITDLVALRDLAEATGSQALESSRLAALELTRCMNDRVALLAASALANGRPLYQPALFDPRSTRLAAERAAVREVHDRHRDRLARVIRGIERPTVQPPVLIGAWLEA